MPTDRIRIRSALFVGAFLGLFGAFMPGPTVSIFRGAFDALSVTILFLAVILAWKYKKDILIAVACFAMSSGSMILWVQDYKAYTRLADHLRQQQAIYDLEGVSDQEKAKLLKEHVEKLKDW